MATEYVFECKECGPYSVFLDPNGDDLAQGTCPRCSGPSERRFTQVQVGRVDHTGDTDKINLGLGKWFPNSYAREDYAKANGYEKLDR